MKVHLRLTEKDVDLCRWKHSLNNRTITHYIRQILNAEMKGEIAYLPTTFKLTGKAEPCEVYMEFYEPVLVEFLSGFSPFRRNATLKRIIRKHLQAQNGRIDKVVYQEDADIKVTAPISIERKIQPKVQEPIVSQQTRKIEESEEDRAAILALIAMGGE